MMDFFNSIPWEMMAWSVGKTLFLIFGVVLPMVSYTVYAERRVSALIQDRIGPNRTGFPLSLLAIGRWTFVDRRQGNRAACVSESAGCGGGVGAHFN